jgi:hypothetical protein
VSLPDAAMMATHDLLMLPRPSGAVAATLRQHASEFLDTVVPADAAGHLRVADRGRGALYV